MMCIRLDKIANGALQEQFGHAFAKVMENLVDVNTPFKDKRKISIDLSFEQDEGRQDVKCDISVRTKLAPVHPVTTGFGIFKDIKNGTVTTEEYGSQIRGQSKLPETDKKVLSMQKQA